MKESYKEDIANHFGLEPYAVDGNIGGVASARGNVGQLSSSEITNFACRSCPVREKAKSSSPLTARWLTDAAESWNLCMRGHSKHENRENPLVSPLQRGDNTAAENGQSTSQTVLLT